VHAISAHLNLKHAETIKLDKDKAAYDKHFTTDYFTALGQTFSKEGLLAAPLNIMTIKPIAGFASR
jgi:hypothetical protein